jgi:flagellar biosynthetic protein FlhB
MAENQDGQEKTEEPTGKRLSDARNKGQIPRSRELNTMAMTMVGAVALIVFGESMIQDMGSMMTDGLTLDRREIFNNAGMFEALEKHVTSGLTIITPFLIMTVIAAFASSTALGGWSFSVENLKPKLEKLSLIKGLKRQFSPKGAMEMLKALAKFLLVGGIAILILSNTWDDMIHLGFIELSAALAGAGNILVWSFLALSSALIVLAVIDIPYQVWEHKKNLKMTKQEVKDESKDTEGKPEIRQKIRQTQVRMAMRRMMEAVPEADVVITNPTHFAVALKYDEDRSAAPIVVARGADNIARQIREKAMAHNVPIFEAPPLARALYHSTELDQEIPAGLYLGVAQVLAYVFQLRSAAKAGADVPNTPSDIPVPDEYYYPPAN